MIARWRARRLSHRFARRLGGLAPELVTGSLLGLEHEYLVRRWSDGRRINFGQLIHRLAPSQRGLEPVDGNAYWLSWGAIVTADETEAELALPPTATRPGFTEVLLRRVGAAERWLDRALGPAYYLHRGVSSHFSVALPEAGRTTAAEHYARAWAPAMMLMLDDVGSPGLLVRPRPGRLEICGEFANGDDLRAAAIFALGGALACHAEAYRPADRLARLELRLRYGDQRYGWYVDRKASGTDLYEQGRATALTTVDGHERTAGEHLSDAWSRARPHLARHASTEELKLVDELVSGVRPLRVERTDKQTEAGRTVIDPSADVPGSAYGRALRPVRRPGFELAPVMLTWQMAVFVVVDTSGSRRAFGVIPGRLLGRFLKMLVEGRLDEPIAAYLRLRPARRIPRKGGQVDQAGLFDGLAMRPALLAPEHPLHAPGAAA